MPDDTEPVSTTVPETTTVDTGADKETAESLNDEFADFWKQEDEKSEGAPSAPGDGAAQETKEKRRERSETPEPSRETETPVPETREYTDEEIDKWGDLGEDPKNPQIKKQFSDIKALWHADRARAKAEADRASKLERELAEARQNSLTPELKADYEHATAVRRKFDFANDPEFKARFNEPIQRNYYDVLNKAVEMLPDRNAATAWARYIAENYSPEQLDKDWWNHSVLEKIPDEMDRDMLRQKVNRLREMQEERSTEVERRTNDKSAFENWHKEKAQRDEQWMRKEVMAEIGLQEQKPFIKERLWKDPEQAKTKEEREAIDRHNEEYKELNGDFQEAMKDLAANGPRAQVRAAVQVAAAERLRKDYKKLETELKTTKTERDQLKKELDKIGGARRRISHTSGTPPTPSGKDASKNGQGLSIKNLDVRDSFKSFDWGDGS